jgi:translation initiation factor 6
LTFELSKSNVNKNPFVGLYARTSDELIVSSPRAPKKFVSLCEETLGAKALNILVNESPFIGVYLSLNSNGCVLPALADEKEVKALERELSVCVLSTNHAPGNTVLCNDSAALVSKAIEAEDCDRIKNALGVKVLHQSFAGMPAFASTTTVTNQGFYAYNDLNDAEFEHLKKLFEVNGLNGSTNYGTPFNSLSIVANSKGAVIGDLSSGVETQRVFEALSGD